METTTMNCEKLCTISDCIGIFISIIVAILIGISCAGCGHNTGAFLFGKMTKIGFDSQNAIPVIMYANGFQATDISRENSGWALDVDTSTGITYDNKGTVKGINSIRRYVGPQITGNLVDLAKDNPELAKTYVEAVKYVWQFQAQQNVKKDSSN